MAWADLVTIDLTLLNGGDVKSAAQLENALRGYGAAPSSSVCTETCALTIRKGVAGGIISGGGWSREARCLSTALMFGPASLHYGFYACISFLLDVLRNAFAQP